MRNAWIEVKTKSDTCHTVTAKLRQIAEVKEADALFGNVDVLALASIDDAKNDYLDALETIISRIKSMPDVVTTVTRPAKRVKGGADDGKK